MEQDERRARADHGPNGVDDGTEEEGACDVFLEEEEHRLEEHSHCHPLGNLLVGCRIRRHDNALLPPRRPFAIQRLVERPVQWHTPVSCNRS